MHDVASQQLAHAEASPSLPGDQAIYLFHAVACVLMLVSLLVLLLVAAYASRVLPEQVVERINSGNTIGPPQTSSRLQVLLFHVGFPILFTFFTLFFPRTKPPRVESRRYWDHPEHMMTGRRAQGVLFKSFGAFINLWSALIILRFVAVNTDPPQERCVVTFFTLISPHVAILALFAVRYLLLSLLRSFREELPIRPARFLNPFHYLHYSDTP